MSPIRLPLRKQLWTAWERVIREDYEKQLINSENGLQASLLFHLRSLLPKSRRVFIEPQVFSSDSKTDLWFPDLVVCNSREVIAVLELKYLPRATANWNKDLTKMNRIAELKDSLFVSNTRYLGPPADEREYRFASKTLFGWMGVHRPFRDGDDPPRLSSGHRFLSGCFVQFHAITRHNSAPHLVKALG
ncbi:MAG: hypothetical protein AAFX06_15350 [Planctomycetota bacterium]